MSIDGNSHLFDDDLTEQTLKQYAGCIQSDPVLKALVSGWGAKGKRVETLLDLIMCYYSGIKIICIPHMSSTPSLVLSQYGALVREAQEAVEVVIRMKRHAEILLNSEDLDVYFEHAFHHFSHNPLKPFKFLEAVFHRNPIQPAFKTHVSMTAKALMLNGQDVSGTIPKLATLVASSILLDVRHKGYPQTCGFARVCH